jgi:membrane-associated protein
MHKRIMILDFFMHLDKNLVWVIQTYGFWIYPLLFLTIFVETGLVIMPFLPGDSLIFTLGVLASGGLVNVFLVFFIACLAAIVGDSVNYAAGKFIGNKVNKNRYIKEEYLIKTKKFYEKHGRKTIILARFIPIIRTFAPFVAGVGKMEYKKFLVFNIIGGILWTALFVFAGFFFGNIPFVKNNLSIVIIGIIIVSLIPAVIEFFRSRKKN